MSAALNSTNRSIYYSICNWGLGNVTDWANKTGNSWRTTEDITNDWRSVERNFKKNALHPESSHDYAWNDPDMLEIGNGVLTLVEAQSHFSLWAFAKAPLILGCDLSSISPEELAIVTNGGIIAVNQDDGLK
jgi:alpha-galactosidase